MIKIKKRFKHDPLIEYVYQQRAKLIEGAYSNGKQDTNVLLGLNELLAGLCRGKCVGRQTALTDADTYIKNYIDCCAELNDLDDYQALNKVFVNRENVLRIKYWPVFLEQWANYGFGSAQLERPFQYKTLEDIQHQFKMQLGVEFTQFFEENYYHVNTLRYIFSRYYRNQSYYQYDVVAQDIVVLLSLFFSLSKDFEIWPEANLRSHLRKNAGDARTYEDFCAEYVNGGKTPIIVQINNDLALDKHTLILFIFYLVGLYATKGKSIAEGRRVLSAPKETASTKFEDNARTRLRAAGWKVTDKPFSFKSQLEFDLIAAKDDENRVLLAELKYQDLAPSSMNGKLLLAQELLANNKHGLLKIAQTQQERRDYFISRFASIKAAIPLVLGQIDEPKIDSIVVTKWTPLISHYRNVQLMNFDSFASRTW